MSEPFPGLGAGAGFARDHDADRVALFMPMREAEIVAGENICAVKSKQLSNRRPELDEIASATVSQLMCWLAQPCP